MTSKKPVFTWFLLSMMILTLSTGFTVGNVIAAEGDVSSAKTASSVQGEDADSDCDGLDAEECANNHNTTRSNKVGADGARVGAANQDEDDCDPDLDAEECANNHNTTRSNRTQPATQDEDDCDPDLDAEECANNHNTVRSDRTSTYSDPDSDCDGLDAEECANNHNTVRSDRTSPANDGGDEEENERKTQLWDDVAERKSSDPTNRDNENCKWTIKCPGTSSDGKKDESGVGHEVSHVKQQSRQSDKPIPEWVKTVFKFWTDGVTSDDELKNTISYLVSNEIIIIGDPLERTGDANKPPQRSAPSPPTSDPN